MSTVFLGDIRKIFGRTIMLTGTEYVRAICKERKIKVSALERDLGFGNGYLNPKKLKQIPYDRAVAMAEYLGCDIEPILKGGDEKVIKIPHLNISSLRKDFLSDEEKRMLALFIGLNGERKEKLLKYAEALSYAQVEEDAIFEETDYLSPLAAHESTGIEVSADGQEHDKALIKDMDKNSNS